jgi:hypothetical protein
VLFDFEYAALTDALRFAPLALTTRAGIQNSAIIFELAVTVRLLPRIHLPTFFYMLLTIVVIQAQFRSLSLSM